MKNCFKMSYENVDYIIPKNSVMFVHGYGVANAYYFSESEQMILVGVVDADFKEVIPLTPNSIISKIHLAPEDNIIFRYFDESTNKYIVMHRKSDGTIFTMGASNFYVINNKGTVVLDFDDCVALFDVINDCYLTPAFSVMGPFIDSEKYGCKVAHVSFYQENENKEIVNEISTIISETGEVLTPYEDLATGNEYPEKDLSEVLELCRKKKQ